MYAKGLFLAETGQDPGGFPFSKRIGFFVAGMAEIMYNEEE